MSDQISCVFHYNACSCREAQTARLIREMNDAIRERTARIRALESDLATAIMERDAAVAAGRVLAERIATATRTDGYDDPMYRADEMDTILRLGIGGSTKVDDNTNPIALAWVKAAQEASNGK